MLSRSIRDIIGITHVAGNYFFTEMDYLNEGATQILSVGSRVMKIWFYGKRHEHPEVVYPFNSQWENVDNLVKGARQKHFRDLFSKPFSTFIMVVTALGRSGDYWRDGITVQQEEDEKRQFYELTKYLLQEYRGTGKTFIFQNWEGDWMTRGHHDLDRDPDPKAFDNMIRWINARQAGVEKARAETGCSGVSVYHAVEICQVAMSLRDGRPNIVNKVLPDVNVDLVSYSSYDTTVNYWDQPAVFNESIDYIASHAAVSKNFGRKNIYIGEFGLPENEFDKNRLERTLDNTVNTALKWGCPYIVYWQLYCNELSSNLSSTEVPPYPQEHIPRAKLVAIKDNNRVRGYWLIKPDGSNAWAWDYFYDLLNNSIQNKQEFEKREENTSRSKFVPAI